MVTRRGGTGTVPLSCGEIGTQARPAQHGLTRRVPHPGQRSKNL